MSTATSFPVWAMRAIDCSEPNNNNEKELAVFSGRLFFDDMPVRHMEAKN